MSQADNGFTHKDGVTLKEFFLSKLESQDKALTLAKEGMDRRLDGMNHIQEQIREMKSTYVSRIEHDTLVKEIRELREFRVSLESKASMMSVYIAYALSIISIVIAFIKLVGR